MHFLTNSLVSKLWFAIVLLVLGVFAFSVIIQAQQINSLVYNQQAKFFIYEAEEVATIYNMYHDTEPNVINQRLGILSKFLSANIAIADTNGTILHGENFKSSKQGKILLDQDFVKRVLGGTNVVFTGKTSGFNEEMFIVAVPLKRNNIIIGLVAISSSISNLKEHVNSILITALIGASIGIILATILSRLVSRTLIRPLVKMEESARSIAEGDFGKQIEVTSEDEIGRLALSFNRMSIQLKEKIEAIHRLDRLRQELLSDVSHELRTPLTVIQGYSEAVLDGLVKSKDQEQTYLKNIIDESERLRRLVDDLLDLKGMESAKTFDEMEYVIINKLVPTVVERLKQIADAKQIRLELVLTDQTVSVWGNIDRLKQVLTNLIDNAIKHSEPGGTVKITLGTKNNCTFIAIKDSGPGIPPEELENIWERFYKVDKSRSRRGTGTGLGLAIVKKIIEMHDGKVLVESKLGQGTAFTIYLQLV